MADERELPAGGGAVIWDEESSNLEVDVERYR